MTNSPHDALFKAVFGRNFTVWGRAFSEAKRQEHGLAALATLMKYLFHVSDVKIEKIRDMIQAQAPETESAVTTIAEQLRQEGRVEGRVEGRFEGGRLFLRDQLVDKFGELDAEQEAKVASLSDAELSLARKRILNADSIDAVLS